VQLLALLGYRTDTRTVARVRDALAKRWRRPPMRKRRIIIPKDVLIINITTGTPSPKVTEEGKVLDQPDDPYTFSKWVLGRLIRDPGFTMNAEGKRDDEAIFFGFDLWQRLKSAKAGDTLEIDEDCWKRIVNVVKSPQIPYDAAIFCQIRDFVVSVKEAKEFDDAVKAE